MWMSFSVFLYLHKLQVRPRSDRVVRYVDLQEGVELVVAAAESRRYCVYTITPVQRVWVVQAKRPWRRFIFCKENVTNGDTVFRQALQTHLAQLLLVIYHLNYYLTVNSEWVSQDKVHAVKQSESGFHGAVQLLKQHLISVVVTFFRSSSRYYCCDVCTCHFYKCLETLATAPKDSVVSSDAASFHCAFPHKRLVQFSVFLLFYF